MKKQKILGKTCTGRIELGDGTTILAGVNGIGTAATDIRFWAGVSFANRATAPFRVQQDGKVIATSGAIGGWNLATDAIYTGTKSTANGFSASGVTFGSDGSIHAPRFYVNADGTVGIRSGSATGKRVVIDSTNNRIDLFNAANKNCIRIDDDLDGSAFPGIKITLAGGTNECAIMGATYFHLQDASGNVKVLTMWDNINSRVVHRLIGLPTSSSGLVSGSVWRNGSALAIVP